MRRDKEYDYRTQEGRDAFRKRYPDGYAMQIGLKRMYDCLDVIEELQKELDALKAYMAGDGPDPYGRE
jgi:hypothetical protein